MALGLALLVAACGDDGATTTAESTSPDEPTTSASSDPSSPLGTVSVEQLSFDAFADLPPPPLDVATANRPPLTEWDGSAVLIGPAGGLVRLGPDEGVEVTPTEGIDVGEGSDRVRAVDLLDSDGETLLAIGHEEDLVADVAPAVRPFAWRSTDGDTWEAVELSGLTYGSDEVTVTALLGLSEGRFLAGGHVDDGDQTLLKLWRTDDAGGSWEEIDADGLDHPDTDEEDERIVGLARGLDMVLATREETGLDDSRLTLLRLQDSDAWEELEPTGLDALDLPNSDVIPTVATVAGQFVMFASTPIDDEFGERTPTLFTSDDGESWTATELVGPTLPDPFFVQAITRTDRGAIAVAEGADGLNIWRFIE